MAGPTGLPFNGPPDIGRMTETRMPEGRAGARARLARPSFNQHMAKRR